MINYIKTAFAKPKEIYIGRNMKKSHFFSLFLLLTLTLTIFSIFEFLPVVKTMNDDINEVKDFIPPFELVDNELESESESYIYQTDTLFFYFDPEDQMTTDTINRNMSTFPIPLSVGLMNDQLYLNIVGQDMSVDYTDLENFTTSDLETFISSFGQFSPYMISLFIIVLFVVNILLLITFLFPISLFANIISVYRRTGLRFFQTAKIALLSVIGPSSILYAVNAFLFPVRFQFELILIGSLILYYMSITEMKERISHQKDE